MSKPPSTLGRVFNHTFEGGVHRYMSDQWNGRLFGFEERDGLCLAQTPLVATGAVGFGGKSVQASRHLLERYPYHLCDEELRPTFSEIQAAEASLAITLDLLDADRRALPLSVPITEAQPGILRHEAEPGSDPRARLDARLGAAVKALESWDKILFVDRLHLSLLEGEDDIDETRASTHYAEVAQSLQASIFEITKQPLAPKVLVCQDSGSEHDGRSDVILAEGRLDVEHPTSDFVVVTPTYWCDFMMGSPATFRPKTAFMVSELEAHALATVHAGQSWYCPLLEAAELKKKTIKARFLSLLPLVLDDGFHGFELDGVENDAKITSVSAKGKHVSIELSKPPKGQLTLRYAFGGTRKRAGRPINSGALRDEWQQKSLLGGTLYRRALSAAVPVK